MTSKRCKAAVAILAIAVLGLIIGLPPCSAQPQVVSYKNVNYNFYDVAFVDRNTGWICGKSGFLFHTKDGGMTWEKLETGVDMSLFGVRFLSPQRGVIAGQQGLVIVSDDGGETWATVEVPTDKTMLTLDFYDDKHGMAAGDWGKIIRTRDGGHTWEEVSLTEDVVLYDLTYVGPEEAWIAGEMGTIFHTTDGGATWEKHEVADGTLFGIDVGSQGHILAVGIEGTVVRSRDGGETWERGEACRESLYNVEINGNLAIAIGDAGTVYTLNVASDNTWRKVEVPVDLKANWLQFIQGLDAETTIIGGARGSISFIRDGELERPEA